MKNVILASACLLLFCGVAWGQTDLAGTDLEVTTLAGPYTNSSETGAWLTFTGTGTVGTVLGQGDGTNSNLGFIWNMSGTDDNINNFSAANYHTLGTTLSGVAGVKVNAVTGAFGSGVVTLDGVTLMNYNYADQTIANDIQISGNGGALRVRSGKIFTFSGNISGGDLELDYDGGILALSGTNTYTGNTIIGSTRAAWADAGATATLRLDSATALPDATRLMFGTVYGQTQLNLNGQSVSVTSVDLIEGQARTSIPTISNTSGTKSTLTVTNDTDLSVSLANTGNLALVWNNITGTGNTISATSYHSGGTILSGTEGSVVTLTANNGTGTGALTLTDVDLELNGMNLSMSDFSGTGSIHNVSETSGSLTFVGNGTFAADFYTRIDSENNFKVIYSQTGEKKFAIDTVANHTRGTEIVGGMLTIGNLDVFGTSPEIGIENSTITYTATAMNTGVTDKTFNMTQNLQLNGVGGGVRLSSAPTVNFSGNITGSGDFWVSYDGGVLNLSGNNTYTGKTIIGSITNCWANSTAVANVVLQSDTAIPTNTVLEMGTWYGGSILDLNGHSITVSDFRNEDMYTGTFTVPQLKSSNGPVTVTMDAGESDRTKALNVNVGKDVTFRKNGTGSFVLGTIGGAGTLEMNGGDAKVLNNISVENLKIMESTTFTVDSGYAYSLHSGSGTDANVTNAMEIRTNMDPEMNTDNPTVWRENSSCCFSTLINLTENTSLSGYKCFDDLGYINLTPVNADGTYGTKISLLNASEWNAVTLGESTDVAAGTYLLEAWGCQGGGGVGSQGGNNFGLGIRTGGVGTAYTDYVKLNIENGTIGGIEQLQVIAPTREISSNVDIASGKTFKLVGNNGSSFILGGQISGEGALVVQAPTGLVAFTNSSTFTGGMTLDVAKVSANRFNGFGAGTVTFQNTDTEVVFSNRNDGWLEGNILEGDANWSETPTTWTAMSTPAITYLHGTTYSSKTAVYQTTIVPTETVTLTFGENLDDKAYLDITNLDTGQKTNVLNDVAWDLVTTGTYTFEKGVKYHIDMRAGLGGSNNGPSDGAGLATPEGPSSFAWRASDEDGWSRLDFSNGSLAGGKLFFVDNYFEVPFDNDVVLATSGVTTTFNAENHFNTISMNGSITGPGNLKLTNGTFALKGTGNSIGSLTLNNATYVMDKDAGFISGTGDVEISHSTLHLNLTGMDAATLTSDLAWITTTGNARISDMSLILDYEGAPLDNVTSIKLVDSADIDVLGDIHFDVTNPELRYLLASGDGGLTLTFGSAASLPEPSTWFLMILAFVGLAGWRKWRK